MKPNKLGNADFQKKIFQKGKKRYKFNKHHFRHLSVIIWDMMKLLPADVLIGSRFS